MSQHCMYRLYVVKSTCDAKEKLDWVAKKEENEQRIPFILIKHFHAHIILFYFKMTEVSQLRNFSKTKGSLRIENFTQNFRIQEHIHGFFYKNSFYKNIRVKIA